MRIEDDFVRAGQGKDIPGNYLSLYNAMLEGIKQWAAGRFSPEYHEFAVSKNFKCPVIIVRVRHNQEKLVIQFVEVRPCAEGHGCYKVLLYELVKLARRYSKELLVDSSLPLNASILTRMGFSSRNYDEEWQTVDMYLDGQKLDQITKEAWNLTWAYNEDDELVAGNFPSADELNSQHYVDIYWDNKDKGKARAGMTMEYHLHSQAIIHALDRRINALEMDGGDGGPAKRSRETCVVVIDDDEEGPAISSNLTSHPLYGKYQAENQKAQSLGYRKVIEHCFKYNQDMTDTMKSYEQEPDQSRIEYPVFWKSGEKFYKRTERIISMYLGQGKFLGHDKELIPIFISLSINIDDKIDIHNNEVLVYSGGFQSKNSVDDFIKSIQRDTKIKPL